MNVAIIGGGLFGLVSAIKISEAFTNSTVEIYEKSDSLMKASSGSNLFRLHRGYHYPRSEKTSIECKINSEKFCNEFERSVIQEFDHYYCIAADGSKTKPGGFLQHCKKLGLKYEKSKLEMINQDSIDLSIKADEDLVDHKILREICEKKIQENNIKIHLNSKVNSTDDLEGYDYTIVATYAHNNSLVNSYPSLQQEYKFQLVEIPIVDLPQKFKNKSILVLDGPFLGIDPLRKTGHHQVYHVEHSIHETTYGKTPQFENLDEDNINNGIILDPPETNFDNIVDHGVKFFKDLDKSDHIGSKYTIRAVLPNVEDTDARPTIINQAETVFTVFSGKLCTSIEAADRVVEKIRDSH